MVFSFPSVRSCCCSSVWLVYAALVAGGLTIYRAGAATRAEISASMLLAEVMANEAVQLVGHGVPAHDVLQTLPTQLRFARHVRVEIKNAAGTPLADDTANSRAAKSEHRAQPPAWFASLISPAVETREIPVTVGGQPIGSVRIVSEPADEIAEVWENTVALGAIAVAMSVALIGVLYLALGRVLGPLTTLSAGFGDLERHRYQVRLPRPEVREFAAITDRFNALAAALDAARTRIWNSIAVLSPRRMMNGGARRSNFTTESGQACSVSRPMRRRSSKRPRH